MSQKKISGTHSDAAKAEISKAEVHLFGRLLLAWGSTEGIAQGCYVST